MSSARKAPRRVSPPRTPHLRLADFLPYRLNVLAAVVSEGLARTYETRFGITIAEWRVIATVGEFDAITATAIGAHAHMSKVKVSRAAAALEDRGLISRVQNKDDLRESFLVLTPTGHDLYGEIVPLALAYSAKLEAGLSDQEIALLDAVVDKLTELARDARATG